MKKLLCAIFIGIYITSCGSGEEEVARVIEPQFAPYVDRFVAEARQMGFEYDLSKLDVVLVDEIVVDGITYCGFGYYNYQNTGRQRVEISSRSDCWSDRSDLEREQLFFHEMGHAILRRLHDNSRLPNGYFKTMMCDQCDIYQVYDENRLHRRPYFLQELYEPSTPTPEWGEIKDNFQEFFRDDINSKEIDWVLDNQGLNAGIDSIDYASAPYALSISSERSEAAFALWVKELDASTIGASSVAQLQVNVSSKELSGEGAGIALVGYDIDGESIFFNTTENRVPIRGNLNQEIFSVDIIDSP
ncbi:MAG: hypothetical protein AAFN93_28295, partial [Bacteroidota bacterium]